MSTATSTVVDTKIDPFRVKKKTKASVEVSRIYNEASALYLTRRLAEALHVLSPIVTEKHAEDSEAEQQQPLANEAPLIATASRKLKVKVWCFYLTLLNAIAELGAEVGQEVFGKKEWNTITAPTHDGSIWDRVVNVGYGGVEGNVDIEVVNNLANLLLAQSPSQKVNQERIELYLSAAGTFDSDLQDSISEATPETADTTNIANRVGSLRDLESRIQLIELYTLHVLPRNKEWDYSKQFIAQSDILDEETREVLLQTLQDLEEDATGTGPLKQLEPQQEAEETFEPPPRHSLSTDSASTIKDRPVLHQRSSSEKDYGIEESPTPMPPPEKQILRQAAPQRAPSHTKQQKTTGPSAKVMSTKPTQTDLYRRSRGIMRALQSIVSNLSLYVSRNPLALLRFVIFLISLLTALSSENIRNRLRTAWDKLKRTVGMGVKVSYI